MTAIVHLLKHVWNHHIAHHLPVALFLACSLSTMDVLRPDVLLGAETMFMRGAYVFDGQLGRVWDGLSVFRQSTLDTQLMPGDESRPVLTVISLSPQAYNRYFHRTSPVPRARLACVLLALSDQLTSLGGLKNRTPVVGIDIDITPVDASAPSPVWLPSSDEQLCFDRMQTYGMDSPPTVNRAMAVAVTRLAQKSCVIAITFPRFDGQPAAEAAASLLELRGTPKSPLKCDRIHFTSPDVMQVPHELVYQYPTSLLPYKRLPLRLRMQLGEPEHKKLPKESCTLGRKLGAYLYKMRMNQSSPCSKEEKEEAKGEVGSPSGKGEEKQKNEDSKDGQAFSQNIPEANAYRQQTIDLGPAHAAVAYSRIEPSGKKEDLLADACQAFGQLQEADIYVLSVDSGTTEDKFLVPVEDDSVPGAWVHAAVALTEFRHPAEEEESKAGAVAEYLLHVALDVLIALLFVSVSELVLKYVDVRRRHRVLREVGLAISPALITAFFGCAYIWWVARGFSAGSWHSPAPLLLGMAFHSYIDIATRGRKPDSDVPDQKGTGEAVSHLPPAGPGPLRARDFLWVRSAQRRHHIRRHSETLRSLVARAWKDRVTFSVQWLWSLALAASVLFGLLPELTDLPWPAGAAASIVAACAYLAAAICYESLPLPWRSKHAIVV